MFAVSHGQAARAAREGWGEAPKMQFGRALHEVAIGWIGARNLGAKEGVERHLQTAQDRPVKGMRLAGVKTLKAANRYLEQESLPQWNERFTVKPADAHWPLRAEHDLAAILCQVEQRVVTNDYTVRFEGKLYQIARTDVVPGLRKATTRIEKRLDGTVAARWKSISAGSTAAETPTLPSSSMKSVFRAQSGNCVRSQKEWTRAGSRAVSSKPCLEPSSVAAAISGVSVPAPTRPTTCSHSAFWEACRAGCAPCNFTRETWTLPMLVPSR